MSQTPPHVNLLLHPTPLTSERHSTHSWLATPPPHSRERAAVRALGLSSGSSTGFQAGPSSVAFSGLMRAMSYSACGGDATVGGWVSEGRGRPPACGAEAAAYKAAPCQAGPRTSCLQSTRAHQGPEPAPHTFLPALPFALTPSTLFLLLPSPSNPPRSPSPPGTRCRPCGPAPS